MIRFSIVISPISSTLLCRAIHDQSDISHISLMYTYVEVALGDFFCLQGSRLCGGVGSFQAPYTVIFVETCVFESKSDIEWWPWGPKGERS